MYKESTEHLCNHVLGRLGTYGFKQSTSSKRKRLLTLTTSKAWQDKHVRHSLLMKERYLNNELTIGLDSLTSEKRKATVLKIIQNRPNQKQIIIKHRITKDILVFVSVKEMKLHFKCNAGTILDFIYQRRNPIVLKDYELISIRTKKELKNKNQYDVKNSDSKKKK